MASELVVLCRICALVGIIDFARDLALFVTALLLIAEFTKVKYKSLDTGKNSGDNNYPS
jgi:hypothetical protein